MATFFGPKLKEAVESGKVPLSEIDDHARRVLYAEFLSGIVDDPPQTGVVDVEKGFEASQRVEEKSIVLLKNSPTLLPINPSKVHTIAIIGGHADVGMISGGGSAQVDPPDGNAIMPPGKGATIWQKPGRSARADSTARLVSGEPLSGEVSLLQAVSCCLPSCAASWLGS